MSNQVTIEEIKAIAPNAAINKWERGNMVRHYINIDGATTKVWLDEKTGKLHIKDGRGLESSEAIATIEALIGCNLIDRRSKAAEYVVVE